MNSTDIRHALAAVPEIAPATEVLPDARGLLHVRRTVVSRNWIVRLLNSWFSRTDYVQVRLDAKGTFFWQQIDGQRSLEDIARDLANRFCLVESESREAVLVFARMLMIRELVCLRVEVPEGTV